MYSISSGVSDQSDEIPSVTVADHNDAMEDDIILSKETQTDRHSNDVKIQAIIRPQCTKRKKTTSNYSTQIYNNRYTSGTCDE